MTALPEAESAYPALLARLSDRGRALATGDEALASDWSTTVGIASHCHRAGFTVDEYLEIITESPVSSGADGSGRVRPHQKSRRAVKAWDWIVDNYAEPTGSVRESLAHLASRVDRSWFRGRTGPTDYAVARAVVEICHERGVYTFNASARTLALQAGIGRKAVMKSLHRLVDLGLLSLQHPARGTDAAVYRLDLNWRLSWFEDVDPVEEMRLRATHPAFLRGALGHTAGRVFGHLLTEAEPLTAKTVARKTGVTVDSAKRALRKLSDAGLVETLPSAPGVRGYRYRLSDADVWDVLDRVAQDAGKDTWAERQAAQFDTDREVRARDLDRRYGRGSTK